MKTIKINWGYKILLLYAGFIGMVLFMITKSMQQRVDLVSADYYDREIKYQETFDRMQNSLSLSTPVEIIHDIEHQSLVVAFPVNVLTQPPSGIVRFVKPDNSSLDFQVNISTDDNLLQHIPLNNLSKGVWNIEVTWHADGNVYFDKERIIIN